MIRKYHNYTLQTNPWLCEEEPHNNHNHQESKATDFFFPIKMIEKLERTQSNTQENLEQTQNPTMGAVINNETTTTELWP